LSVTHQVRYDQSLEIKDIQKKSIIISIQTISMHLGTKKLINKQRVVRSLIKHQKNKNKIHLFC